MTELSYVELAELDPEALRILMNKQKTRQHLMDYELFDATTIKSWLQEKAQMDQLVGCRVRGILSDDTLAGWCGIQREGDRYELAIVLDEAFWGAGKRVFTEMMRWAQELGHQEVLIHLLHTRPEFKFLRRMSNRVFTTHMHGNLFTTYQIPVSSD